jgi:hypothetical protein
VRTGPPIEIDSRRQDPCDQFDWHFRGLIVPKAYLAAFSDPYVIDFKGEHMAGTSSTLQAESRVVPSFQIHYTGNGQKICSVLLTFSEKFRSPRDGTPRAQVRIEAKEDADGSR